MKKIINLIQFALVIVTTNLYAQNSVPQDFVYAEDDKFMLNGAPYYFTGTNVYDFFTFGGTSGDPEADIDKVRIDNHMTSLYNNGVRVVRLWGFSHEDWHGFEPEKGVYSERQFILFDYLVQSARNHGMRLIVTFENYWEAYGGIIERLAWEGINANTTHAQGQFFTNTAAIQGYKNYVEYFVNRVNHYNDIAYKDDPTIFAWELMNEPRYQGFGDDFSSNVLRAWIDDVGAFVKSLDPHHMISSGIEGHGLRYNFGGDEGNDFIKIHESPYIDFCSAHPYFRESWSNFNMEEAAYIFSEWSDEAHLLLKKPLFIGEFNVEPHERDEWMPDFYHYIEDEDIGGSAFWWFTDHSQDAKFGIMDGSPELQYVKNHAVIMDGKSGGEIIYASLISPSDNLNILPGSSLPIKCNLTNIGGDIQEVEFFVNGASVGIDQTAPYEMTWNNIPEGTYSITATAKGTSGNQNTTPEKTLNVGYQGFILTYINASPETSSNTIKAHYNIKNQSNSDVNYEDLTLKYWYKSDVGDNFQFYCDYAKIGSNNVTGSFTNYTGQDYFVEVGFKASAGVLKGGASSEIIETKIAKSTWANMDQSDDYSFGPVTTSFEPWEKVTMYYKGQLIWGAEPTLGNQSPTAIFSYTVNGTIAPVIISLDASQSSDPENDTLTFDWKFGDTATGQGITASHEYTNAGTYVIELTVGDGNSISKSTKEINIGDGTPTANFTVSSLQNDIGELVTFDGSSSNDPAQSALDFIWNFGDGNTATGTNTTHAYDTPGSYTVSLKVTNSQGLEDTKSQTVIVNDTSTVDPGCYESLPRQSALPTIANRQFNYGHVIGSNGPDFSNLNNFTINWDLANNGLWQFSILTTDGIPNWWNDLLPSATHSFNTASPQVTIAGSQIPGFDGDYYVDVSEDFFIMQSTNNQYTILFSNDATTPDCGQTSRRGTLQVNKTSMIIYPVPSNDFFTITNTGQESIISLSISDTRGQEMRLRNIDLNVNKIVFGHDLKPGTYILSIGTDSGQELRKIIKL